jgi:hypothetical protein
MNEADSIRLHGAASIGRLFVLWSTNQNTAASQVCNLLSAGVVFLASSLALPAAVFYGCCCAPPLHPPTPPTPSLSLSLSFSLGERKLSKKMAWRWLIFGMASSWADRGCGAFEGTGKGGGCTQGASIWLVQRRGLELRVEPRRPNRFWGQRDVRLVSRRAGPVVQGGLDPNKNRDPNPT